MMGLDHSTGKYVPRTAESMTPNADFTQWTTKIRAGIKFTDGTDYNADAVKFTLDREMKDGNAASKVQLTNFIDTVTVCRPTHIELQVEDRMGGFPYLFTHVPGMIYSPTQFKKVAIRRCLGEPRWTPAPARSK